MPVITLPAEATSANTLTLTTVTETAAAVTLNSTKTVTLCNRATAMTITLPTAASLENRTFFIKNINIGVVTIDGAGAETIDGAATYDLSTQYSAIAIYSNGTGWFII